jgi:hypothetical protein
MSEQNQTRQCRTETVPENPNQKITRMARKAALKRNSIITARNPPDLP